MAKKRKRSSGRTTCKRVRIKGHSKTICRSKRTGRIVSSRAASSTRRKASGGKRRKSTRKGKRRSYSGNLVCPSRYKGRTVGIHKGRCYIKLKSGRWRWVKKVRPSRARMKLV